VAALSPLWLAFRTVADGMSANKGYQMAREAGLAIRRQTWLRMVGEVRNHYAQSIAEMDRPQNRRPTGTEVTPLTSKHAKGYLYYVDLFVRDKGQSELRVRPQVIRTQTPMTRQAAVDYAASRYRRAVDRAQVAPSQWGTDPDEVVEGGMFAAAQQFVPE
jgi:hypothetical protein